MTAFFSSEAFQWVIFGVSIYLGVLWLSLVAWVARDIVSRSRSLLFQTLMILVNMALPVFGLFVYLLLRPPKTLMEKYYDELEYNILKEATLSEETVRKPKKISKKVQEKSQNSAPAKSRKE